MTNPKSPFPEPKLLIIIAIICVIAVGVVYKASSDMLHKVIEKSIEENRKNPT